MISLIGGRGSGKSTVGRLLAAGLDVPFFDADRACEESAGRSIADIFAGDGEATFRSLEAETIARLLKDNARGVLATGGGCVLNDETRVLLKKAGPVVWLTAEAGVLAARVTADEADAAGARPSLTGRSAADEMADVLKQRRPLYQSVATITEPVGERSPAQIAASIAERLAVAGDSP